MSDVWTRTAQFLSSLNREDVSRKDYVMLPEMKLAEEKLEEKEVIWDKWMEGLCDEDKAIVEDIKDCLEEYSSALELRSYLQGYVDSIQILSAMGLLNKRELDSKLSEEKE